MKHMITEATATLLRQQDAAKRQVIVDAAAAALRIMTRVGSDSSISEAALVSIVASRAGCRQQDAAYAVDSLRTAGVFVKNWLTGSIKLDSAAAEKYQSRK
jgi:hypothetical protein